ncbi:MAG TPA: glycosyltransferase family 2 protein [Anaerolineales bacterium]|nr:glycosyltransferase family 2 protein [Anaerolineales bacterium]
MVINNSPLVTVITPVYNGSQYLEDLIESVLSQDYPNIEHIIIDDGSIDNGATVATLGKHPYLNWWSQENKGQYATMNEGILAAKGEILCFVNADDVVIPNAVRSAVQYLQAHPFLDGVFGSTGYIDQNGKDYPYWIPFQFTSLRFYPYFAHISHCSLYIKKQSIRQYGLFFDPSLRFVGDYEWIIRIYKAGLRIGMLRQQLSKVRIHTDQTSQKNKAESALEAKTVLKTQHINHLSYFLLSAINLFLLRIWKSLRMLKTFGVRGTLTYLAERMAIQRKY